MISGCITLRFGSLCDLNSDRLCAARYHRQLTERQYWECSTPSCALAVLDVLTRSGTVVSNLDHAASGALNAMIPSMTKSEQVALEKYSKKFAVKKIPDVCAIPFQGVKDDRLEEKKGDACVLALYSRFLSESEAGTSSNLMFSIITMDLVKQLSAETSLMLLEMLCLSASKTGDPCCSIDLARELLTRLRHHVLHSELINFKALWWLFDILVDPKRLLFDLPNEKSCLFRACLKRLHELMPKLSLGECLLLFSLLDNSPYGRPFVLCTYIERSLVMCSDDELNTAPTSVLVKVVSIDRLNVRLVRKICHALYRDTRIGDLNKNQSLSLLSTIASRLAPNVAIENDNLFCESLFAQLYTNAREMDDVECVKALECLELVGLPPFSVPAPCDLLVRLKKKGLAGLKVAVKRTEFKEDELELLLEAVYRLEKLLARCSVLPFLNGDAETISDITNKLRGRLMRLH